jgi:pyruvate formate lyase activating enzyme
MGKYKWKQLGITYSLENTEPPEPETVEWACEIFRTAGLQAY